MTNEEIIEHDMELGGSLSYFQLLDLARADERAKLSKGGVRVFVSWDEEKHATTACAVPVLSIDKPKFINHGIVGNHYYYDENDELCIGLTHAIGKHLNVQKGECKAFEIRECL